MVDLVFERILIVDDDVDIRVTWDADERHLPRFLVERGDHERISPSFLERGAAIDSC